MGKLVLVLALAVLTGTAFAAPEPNRVPSVLQIEGMEPITAADLTRFTGLAVRLANAGQTDPMIQPMLLETVIQKERGIVKRSVAYLALCAMGQEPTARGLLSESFRDRAVMKIVRACLADAESLTRLP